MKSCRVLVPWREGLHLRPAAILVGIARSCRSCVRLKANQKVADARSVLGILLLCATLGTPVLIEAQGEDEELALSKIESVFHQSDDGSPPGPDPSRNPSVPTE